MTHLTPTTVTVPSSSSPSNLTDALGAFQDAAHAKTLLAHGAVGLLTSILDADRLNVKLGTTREINDVVANLLAKVVSEYEAARLKTRDAETILNIFLQK